MTTDLNTISNRYQIFPEISTSTEEINNSGDLTHAVTPINKIYSL